ncbi:MAG TPA: FecR domain-containing protein [Gemmataceae bacterium]|nr:FecR domain-containing protein [Gemmataceae bacterium]
MNAPSDTDLLHAYLDDSLTASDRTAIEERLRREPALADALVILAREEAILGEWARSARFAEQTATETMPPSPRESADPGVTVPSEPRRTLSRRAAVRSLAVLAAGVLLGVLGIALHEHRKTGGGDSLANVEEVQGDVFIVTPTGLRLPAQPGQKLFAEQELRTGAEGSFAVIEYEDKTRLELSPETMIRLLGEAVPGAKNKRTRGKKVFLNEGVLAAEVVAQPADSPMIVTTPHAVMEMQQCLFSSSTAKEATRIELDDGHIRFTRRSDGRSIEVAAGCYAVAAARPESFAQHPLPARIRKPRAIFNESPAPILSLAYSPDGRVVVLGCRDGTLRFCDLQTGIERTVTAGRRKVSSVVFAPSGKTLAAVVDDRIVRLWDATALQEQRSFTRRKLKFTCLAFTRSGNDLATGSSDRSVTVWDSVSGLEKTILRGQGGDVMSLAFSPDARTLAVGSGRGKETGDVTLWDLSRRQQLHTLEGHAGPVRSLAFSADGQILATGSDDGTVRLWNAETGQLRTVLQGHARRVVSIAVSPDGLRLASAGNDNTARLWDLTSGTEQAILKARKHRTSCLAFSPDGKILATGGWDKTVRLWDLAAKDLGPEESNEE